MNGVNVDLVGREGGQGVLASELASGQLNIGRMRPYRGKDGKFYFTVYKGGDPSRKSSWAQLQANAATLRRDEWKALDEAVIGIAEKRLTGVQDLINSGLTYNLGNAMGTTVLEYHDLSDALEAEVSMDAVTRADGDRPEFNSVYLPIPIIHADYEINERALMASRNMSNPLDTTMAERAARKVGEKLESMLFSDETYKFGGGTIYSYTNYPKRVTDVVLAGEWDDPTYTGQDMVQDVLAMKQASIDDHFHGPFHLYIPTNYETKLDEDYSTSKGSNTIRERILQISNIEDIIVVDELASDNVLLVQMTNDVVRLVQGLSMQNIQWQTQGGFVNKFKVISIQVPQIRADQNGNTGLIHAQPAST